MSSAPRFVRHDPAQPTAQELLFERLPLNDQQRYALMQAYLDTAGDEDGQAVRDQVISALAQDRHLRETVWNTYTRVDGRRMLEESEEDKSSDAVEGKEGSEQTD